MNIFWTEDEDEFIRLNYPLNGPYWDGWDKVLLGRSPKAISMRAMRLGVARKHRRKPRRPMTVVQQIVVGFMEDGLAPSEIDSVKGWKAGTAHDAMVSLWASQREQEEAEGGL